MSAGSVAPVPDGENHHTDDVLSEASELLGVAPHPPPSSACIPAPREVQGATPPKPVAVAVTVAVAPPAPESPPPISLSSLSHRQSADGRGGGSGSLGGALGRHSGGLSSRTMSRAPTRIKSAFSDDGDETSAAAHLGTTSTALGVLLEALTARPDTLDDTTMSTFQLNASTCETFVGLLVIY